MLIFLNSSSQSKWVILTCCLYCDIKLSKQSFAKRLIEDLFLFYLFVYSFILFTASLDYRLPVERKELTCWTIECHVEKNVCYQLQQGYLAYMPHVNQCDLQVQTIWKYHYGRNVPHGFHKGGRALIFSFTLKSITPMTVIPQLQEDIAIVIIKWFCWMSDRTVPTEKAGMVKRHIILVEKKFTPKTLESYSESWTNLKPESPWTENALEKLWGDDNLSSQPRSHGNRIPVIFLTTTELANAGNLPRDAVLGKFPK